MEHFKNKPSEAFKKDDASVTGKPSTLGTSNFVPLEYNNNDDLDLQLRNDNLRFNDLPFTFVFLVILIGYIICWFHICDVASLTTLLTPPSKTTSDSSVQPHLLLTHFSSPIISLFFSSILTITITVSLISLFLKYRTNYVRLMQASFIANSSIFGISSLYFFIQKQYHHGITSTLIFLMTLLFMHQAASKLPRSASLLKLIVTIITHNPILCFISLVGTFISLTFIITWMVLLSQIYYKWNELINYQNGSYWNPEMILTTLFASFSGAYITEVIRNTTLTTLSAMYASWYFTNTKSITTSNTLIEVKNSLTYRFGSICLGSFIVSFIEFTVQSIDIFKTFFTDRNSLLHLILTILSALVGLLEDILRYFNNYVFSFIAIFGTSFIQSSKEILTKIKREGWSIVQNDCIINMSIQMMTLVISLLNSGLCYLYLKVGNPEFNKSDDFTVFFPLFGFIVSAEICHVLYSVLMAGNNTLIMSLIFHPEIALRAKFQHYRDLLMDVQEQWPELQSLI